MGEKKVVYISGPITGVKNYWEVFQEAREHLEALGYIVLNPSDLPEGLTDEQYMRIDLAMLDAADYIHFLPGSENSKGSNFERAYAEYHGKVVL